MLNLIFQKAKAKNPDDVWVDSRWFFKSHVQDGWFEDDFVKMVIKDIDNASVIEGTVLRGFNGKAITANELSTGSKTAICIYLYPELIFNVTQMGDNVFRYVASLSQYTDRTVLTYRELPYNLLKQISVAKDYEPVKFSNSDDFWDLFEEWLKEMYND